MYLYTSFRDRLDKVDMLAKEQVELVVDLQGFDLHPVAAPGRHKKQDCYD